MKYAITIPEPCTENWNNMTPTEKGMFCNQCSKEVINFTNYSNYGLAKLLDSNEKVCGRFKQEQLNKEFSSLQSKNVFSSGLAFGVVSLLSLCTPVQSQNIKPTIEILEQNILTVGEVAIAEIPETTTITGTIQDGEYPLPGANITLKGSDNGVQTDFDGNFSIKVLTNNTNTAYTLVVSYIGFFDKEIIINNYKKDINIVMTENDEMMLGEIIVIEYKENVFSRIGNIFRKKY